MRIGEICTRDIVVCDRGASVAELAQLMRNRHVGDVIVVEPREDRVVPVGVVTDRDLVVRVLAGGTDAGSACAGDLMSRVLVTIAESEVVYDAIWYMRSKGIRRLPVVDSRNCLVGILTADDVTKFLADELREVARIAPRQVSVEQAMLSTLTA